MRPFETQIDRSGTYTLQWDGREKRFDSSEILPLWVADMDLPSPECITNALKRRAGHPIYGYTIYPERFFEAICGWMKSMHGWNIEKNSIVPVPGVVPALNFLVNAFSRPQDGIIIQPPVYHPFFRLGKNHNRRLLENRLLLENGRYKIDFDDFYTKAKEAKLFILCSPHNPVGRVWEREELEKMVEICLSENLLIISDEIHADIVFAPNRHIPTALISREAADITITLNAPSKSFNIAGLNTAYAIVENETKKRRFETELERYDLTMGNLFGIEALIWAYEEGEDWIKKLLKHLKGNIEYVKSFLDEASSSVHPLNPEATYLMWLDCRGLGMDDRELTDFFVKKAKLGLNSGISFGTGGSGFMRLNIGCSRKKLERAMLQLKNALDEL